MIRGDKPRSFCWQMAVEATYHNTAVTECRRSIGYKPESKYVVAMATHNLASWEHGETSAGIPFTLVGCNCPSSSARGGSVWGYPVIPDIMGEPERREFSVRYVTIYTAFVFPSPYLPLDSFHISQNPPRVSGFFFFPIFHSKFKNIYISVKFWHFHHPFFQCTTPKMRMKTGWFKPSYWLSSGCKWSLCTPEPWGRKCAEVIVGREQQHLRKSLFDLVGETWPRPKVFACHLKFSPRKF